MFVVTYLTLHCVLLSFLLSYDMALTLQDGD